jgi:hypothetical protein
VARNPQDSRHGSIDSPSLDDLRTTFPPWTSKLVYFFFWRRLNNSATQVWILTCGSNPISILQQQPLRLSGVRPPPTLREHKNRFDHGHHSYPLTSWHLLALSTQNGLLIHVAGLRVHVFTMNQQVSCTCHGERGRFVDGLTMATIVPGIESLRGRQAPVHPRPFLTWRKSCLGLGVPTLPGPSSAISRAFPK